MLAATIVLVTLAAIGRHEFVAPPRCPDGVLCIVHDVPSVRSLALTFEPCAERLREQWRDLRTHGTRAVGLYVPIVPHAPATRVDPAIIVRRGIARATELAAGAGVTLVVLIDAAASETDCRTREVTELVSWMRHAPALAEATARGRLRAFCSPGATTAAAADGVAVSRNLYTELAIVAAEPRPDAEQRANDGASPPPATLIDVPPGACLGSLQGLRDLVARRPDAIGFVVASPPDANLLRNDDFRDGWNDWQTSGPLRLERPEAEEAAVSCDGLHATLQPGARITQDVWSHGAAAQLVDLEMAIEVERANEARRLLVRVASVERELEIARNVSRVTTELSLELPARLRVEVATPTDAPSAVTLRRVRLSRAQAGCVDRAQIASGLARLGVPRTAEDAADPTVAKEYVLDPALARITAARETFVPKVQRLALDDGSGRSGILAHPGPTQPTQLRFAIPALACPRRFRAGATIASSCRGIGDGVRFTARSRDREAAVEVSAASAEPVAIELELDAPDPGGAHRSATELVLRTESGAAHDARCDWAVWLAPSVTCAVEASTDTATVSSGSPASPRSIDVAAHEPARPVTTRWDEINVWKLHAWFGPHRPGTVPGSNRPGWLRERVPWVTHARVMAALGGNSCRHIREQCRRGIESRDHPFATQTWECVDGRAEQAEILKEDDAGRWRLDFDDWNLALDDLLASGLLPHVNVSAAPCALSGGHEYRDYHWNQRPVVDRAGWHDLVDGAARRIAERPSAGSWRFSIVNEPNCLWIAPPASRHAAVEIRHIGFTGSSEQYAAQFAETAAMLRKRIPDARIHLGNFTIGGKYPLEDSLPEYLGALAKPLAAHGLSSDGFSAVSFSLYESPQHRLGDIASYKFGRLDQAITADSPFAGLRIKIDEVEIHELVLDEFRAATGADLDATRWAAAWHAEFLALAMEKNVVSVAPWLGRLFADPSLSRPNPKYWAYAFAALAMGDVVPERLPLRRARSIRPASADVGRAQVRSVHLAADDPDGIGWLVTEAADGTVHALLWRHGEIPRTDADADRAPPVAVHVLTKDACRSPGAVGAVELLSVDRELADDATATPWRPDAIAASQVRATTPPVVSGEVRLHLGSESVHLLRIDCGGAHEGVSG